jgi:hypothetical protein
VSAVNSPFKIGKELAQLVDGDVIFGDEVHGLSKITMELLHTAMEDGRIEISSGKGDRIKSWTSDDVDIALGVSSRHVRRAGESARCQPRRCCSGRPTSGRPEQRLQRRSNRSRFMTLFHAVTKSRTSLSWASSQA